MHVFIVAVGSAGDVHPFIAIGRALRARGHEVELMSAAPFGPRVEAAGLGFVPFGSSADHEHILARAELWHPRHGFALLADELLRRLPAAHATLVERLRADSVMVGSTLAWNVRLAQETHRRPAATVHLSPSALPSAYSSPVLPGIGDLSFVPAALLRPLLAVAEAALIGRRRRAAFDAVRAGLGLPPVGQRLSRWMHAPDLVVAAWPDWFAPPQPDWPAHSATSGFARMDHVGRDAGLPAALARF